LKAPHAEFLGEISDAQKGQFLGDAAALLFPIDWPEPFGLAMIEAMANGTPVVAMRRGSVPEVIDDGITGFVVNDIAGAMDALPRALHLDRDRVRQHFGRRFSSYRMARDYVSVYESLIVKGFRPAADSAEQEDAPSLSVMGTSLAGSFNDELYGRAFAASPSSLGTEHRRIVAVFHALPTRGKREGSVTNARGEGIERYR
jgi:hypothetical protein